MGTGQTNKSTQAKVNKPPRCAICYKVISDIQSCDWRQGRRPHRPALVDTNKFKKRFTNLINFLKGK
jgi:hypothetical protein